GRMGAIDKKAQTGGVVRNCRIDHGQGIDPLPEEGLRESYRLQGISYDHWNDRGTAVAGAGIQAPFPGEHEKKPGELMEALHPLGLLPEQSNGGQRCCDIRRRHSDAVDKARRSVFQIFDEGSGSGDVAAATGKGFAQGAHPKFHIGRIDSKVFANTPAPFPQYTDGMSLVHHQEGSVPFLNLNEFGQFRDIAIHAVNAFDNDEGPPETGSRLPENHVQGLPVVVGKRKVRCLGQLTSLENTVVYQGIMNDEVGLAEEMADSGDVGGMPAHKDKAVLCSNEVGNFFLKLTMQWSFA